MIDTIYSPLIILYGYLTSFLIVIYEKEVLWQCINKGINMGHQTNEKQGGGGYRLAYTFKIN